MERTPCILHMYIDSDANNNDEHNKTTKPQHTAHRGLHRATQHQPQRCDICCCRCFSHYHYTVAAAATAHDADDNDDDYDDANAMRMDGWWLAVWLYGMECEVMAEAKSDAAQQQQLLQQGTPLTGKLANWLTLRAAVRQTKQDRAVRGITRPPCARTLKFAKRKFQKRMKWKQNKVKTSNRQQWRHSIKKI